MSKILRIFRSLNTERKGVILMHLPCDVSVPNV